jgi:hypothetical protein
MNTSVAFVEEEKGRLPIEQEQAGSLARIGEVAFVFCFGVIPGLIP